ncbi:permease prefix domain 1-containing protein [Streptomyces sp. WMMB303]|uniref:permease prefix domain 1-containing protein n=1 Tax=Streptomyces sp. WMMB303 TaxID=3034154 RepID=UPI0023EDD59F|nr:permease prefix domain 1-containing protein [Streptomyces sp. WMMB303]MDF4253476.1 permease prefix domain 1-containing protein [Streptomyces sp. WMMB303]
MSAPQRRPDPLLAYTAELRAALPGPARAASRMVEEIHHGLLDAADTYVREGVPRADAAHRAVRDSGPVAEVAPACRRELALAQTRHTARAAALCAPLLLACWALARTTLGTAAAPLALLAAVSALLAVAALAGTGGPSARRFGVPEALPRLVAWTGTGASAAMAAATLTLACTAAATARWPLLLLAGALSAASHAVLGTSVRVSRRCLAHAG